ncbi:hypothetical protein D3C81_1976430 [compost metagenome]
MYKVMPVIIVILRCELRRLIAILQSDFKVGVIDIRIHYFEIGSGIRIRQLNFQFRIIHREAPFVTDLVMLR